MTVPSKKQDPKKTTPPGKVKPSQKKPSQKKQKTKDPKKGTEGGQVETDHDRERGRRLVELAIQLVVAQIGPEDRGKLSKLEYDDIFDDALRRADRTLILMEGGSLPAGEDPEVQAYQLFTEGESLVEEKIMKRFLEYQWKDLKAKGSVTKLMKELRVHFEDERSDLTAGEELDTWEILRQMKRDIPELLNDHFRGRGFLAAIPDLQTILDNINRIFDQALEDVVITRPEGRLDRYREWDKLGDFVEWCFVPEEDKKRHRKYRPHEVFRFAASRGWSREKLTRRRSELPAGKVPGPRRTGPFDRFEQERIGYTDASEGQPTLSSPETSPRDPED